MPAVKLNDRVYEEVIVRSDPDNPLPVDIKNATISATIESVEIANNATNPIPISDAGASITVDNAELASINGKLPALVDGKVPVAVTVDMNGAATEAKQDDLIALVDGVEALLTAIDVKLPATVSDKLPVTGPLTNTELRASSLTVSPDIQQGDGVVTASTTRVTLASNSPGVVSLGNISADLGARADAVAGNDTGTYSLIALVKRVLQGLTSINERLATTRTPVTVSIGSSATSVQLLAANSSRRGVSIANDSNAVLRLSFTTPATTSNAFIVLQPGSFILLDQQLIIANAIYGIWTAANGTAQVTEYT